MIRGIQIATALVAASCVLVATGCSARTPGDAISASAKPISSPRFKSDADALNAAREVYELYLTASQKVSEAGGRDASRLKSLVSASEYISEQKSAKYLAENGLRSVGVTKLVKFEAQHTNLESGDLRAYACVDLSAVEVVDARGTTITPANRPSRQTSVPHFKWESGHFVLDSDDSWSGESIC